MQDEISCESIRRSGIFNNMDLELGRYVTGGNPDNAPVLFLAGALASWAVQQGHSCCDLKQLSGTVMSADEEEAEIQLHLPLLEDFRKALRLVPQMAVLLPEQTIGKQPLILDGEGHLYLNRYYHYERNIAKQLLSRLHRTRTNGTDWNELPGYPPGRIAGISKLFSSGESDDGDGPDYQQAAVFLAHERNFSIITGGPGTGKTTVMTALLAWEIADNPQIRIRLCAPTGKAVNRMKSAIFEELPQITGPDQVLERLAKLPDSCTTVDSLLHPIFHTPNFRRNRNNPIEADLVVLDEVSMSSLSQLGHLFDALNPETRLVLIGDRDQLSSVEAGSVLGDLIGEATVNVMPQPLAARFEQTTGRKFPVVSDDRPLSGAVIELQKNHRAKNARIICELSNRIRKLSAGEDLGALSRDIAGMKNQQFCFSDLKFDEKKLRKELTAFLQPARDMIRLASTGKESDLPEAFEKLNSSMILCAVRAGLTGVENVNRIAASLLNLRSIRSVGMPLIVLENTPLQGLSNGDIGLVWKSEKDSQPVVVFPGANDTFRMIHFAEMPPFESVFAMTVHKSQGSGYSQVMVLFPSKDSPILTRELIYTAITRAKNSVRLYAPKEILEKSLGTPIVRYSGMNKQLKDNPK